MTLDYLDHLDREARRFGAVLRDADPAARVPSCPEWAADDLLWHMAGSVFFFWTTVVRLRDFAAVEQVADPDRPADHAGLFAFWERSRDEMLAALRAVNDDEPMWTWSSDHTAGFIKRRMAQETLIHRVDAELTVDARSDIDPALAADGIAESLEHFVGGVPSWAAWDDGGPSGPVGALDVADTGTRYVFRVGTLSGTHPSGRRYEREPGVALLDGGARPTFAVRGMAVDLDLWLWNRPPVGEIEVEGSRADYAEFEAVVRSGI